jgi:hypothetical protein
LGHSYRWRGNDFVIEGHDRYSAKLKPFGQAHRADRDVTACRFDPTIQHLVGHSEFFDS